MKIRSGVIARMSFKPTSFQMGLAAMLLCSIVVVSSAENGRNFAGQFRLRNVQDDVLITIFSFEASLSNYSGTDVKDATLSIESRDTIKTVDTNDYHGAVEHVSIPYRKSATIQGTFSVPTIEFQAWRKGISPRLVITFSNTSGEQVRSVVEVKPAI